MRQAPKTPDIRHPTRLARASPRRGSSISSTTSRGHHPNSTGRGALGGPPLSQGSSISSLRAERRASPRTNAARAAKPTPRTSMKPSPGAAPFFSSRRSTTPPCIARAKCGYGNSRSFRRDDEGTPRARAERRFGHEIEKADRHEPDTPEQFDHLVRGVQAHGSVFVLLLVPADERTVDLHPRRREVERPILEDEDVTGAAPAP